MGERKKRKRKKEMKKKLSEINGNEKQMDE